MNYLPGRKLYEFCVSFLRLLTRTSAQIINAWDKPLLPEWFLTFMDQLPDEVEEFILDVLRLSSWGDLTLEWCVLASLLLLLGALLVKWILSWLPFLG